jgi:hypothetical protein
MQAPEALGAARLANLEGALLALLREHEDMQVDGLSVSATVDAGQVAIDLQFLVNGVPLFGQSL